MKSIGFNLMWTKSIILFAVLCSAGAKLVAGDFSDRRAVLAIPSVEGLPIQTQEISRKTLEGVELTEMYLNGAPFGGAPTKIYGWYARPAGKGNFPSVVRLHGAGLNELTPDAAIYYAKNGFACFLIDWAGECKSRPTPRKAPFSEFTSPGNMAYLDPDQSGAPAAGRRKAYAMNEDGIVNGVKFVRRSFQFLRSRAEVRTDELCLSGMSAGAHLSLLVLGLEPDIRAAAIKYGSGYIRELNWSGYFGPMSLTHQEEHSQWLAVMDPKHGLADYKTSVLMLSGTDDIFFQMPAVLQTYRTIPSPRRLLMLPNDNHTQVGNEIIPLHYFKSVLRLSPEYPVISDPVASYSEGSTALSVQVSGSTPITKVSFWIKRMPTKTFDWRASKALAETAKWIESPARQTETNWVLTIPSVSAGEQIVAYATAEDSSGARVSSDSIEIPRLAKWRLP